MKTLPPYVAGLLGETSTYVGLAKLGFGTIGWTVSASLTEQIIAAGLAIAGVISTLLRDRPWAAQ